MRRGKGERIPKEGVLTLARDASGAKRDLVGVYVWPSRAQFNLLGRQVDTPGWWLKVHRARYWYKVTVERGQVVRVTGPPWTHERITQYRKPIDVNPRKEARRRAGLVTTRWRIE